MGRGNAKAIKPLRGIAMAYKTRRQIREAQEKRERVFDTILWVLSVFLVGFGAYAIGVLKL